MARLIDLVDQARDLARALSGIDAVSGEAAELLANIVRLQAIHAQARREFKSVTVYF